MARMLALMMMMVMMMTPKLMMVAVSSYNQNGLVQDWPTDYSDPVSGHLALLRIQRRLDLGSI